MKKKIKDLTLEECRKICEKQDSCSDCPIYDEICGIRIIRIHLEREVEVDE